MEVIVVLESQFQFGLFLWSGFFDIRTLADHGLGVFSDRRAHRLRV
jgi:hypothetical protein